jgi:Replication-relaxation
MKMNNRDKDIVEGLQKFRILNRDQIVAMYFKKIKDNISSCNKVMKRLERDGLVKTYKDTRPFSYYPCESTIKRESTKVPHFRAIVDFYIELCKLGKPTVFEVEYKVGDKGSIEPDIYMVWNRASFFVEIQRDHYTKKRMDAKFMRYMEYYRGDTWRESMKQFPIIWIVSETKYRDLNWDPLRVYQSATVQELVAQQRNAKKKETE